jgi:lipopolysaccharide export system protein LptA
MKKILLLVGLALTLFAKEQIEVSADTFEADEHKLVSTFSGHVHIKKGADEISANYLVIDFNKQNKPKRYEATGGVSFEIQTSSQHFVGTSQKIIYEPLSKKYIALGNVKINETMKNQKLRGESITIDRISGKAKLKGSKNRPVKFIFTVDE